MNFDLTNIDAGDLLLAGTILFAPWMIAGVVIAISLYLRFAVRGWMHGRYASPIGGASGFGALHPGKSGDDGGDGGDGDGNGDSPGDGGKGGAGGAI